VLHRLRFRGNSMNHRFCRLCMFHLDILHLRFDIWRRRARGERFVLGRRSSFALYRSIQQNCVRGSRRLFSSSTSRTRWRCWWSTWRKGNFSS
jgi:hypothetical protein